MLKWVVTFAAAAVSAIVLAFCFVPRDSAQGIELGRTLYLAQSPLENFHYRRLVRNAVGGDANAMAKLVAFGCGGGAGCYDHGAVLAHMLIKVGDSHFSRMAGTLDMNEKRALDSLLAAGFEYGFPVSFEYSSTRLKFPLTVEALSQGDVRK